MYQVIGNHRTRTTRVLWMLEELDQPYALVQAGPHSAEARARNPSGKVPILVVEGQVLTDSTAILQFLADRHGALTRAPGSIGRGQQDGATHFLLDEFDALLWTAARHSFVLPEAWRVPEVKESLKWEYRRSLARLGAWLGDGPFLMGADLTVPDIIAGHCLTWGEAAKFPAPEGEVAAYLARLRARPAYAAATGL